MSKIEEGIDKRIALGKFYDAHQMLKTVISRLSSRKLHAEAIATCVKYAQMFSSPQQHELTGELATMTVNCYIDQGRVEGLKPDQVMVSEDVQKQVQTLASLMPVEAGAHKMKFLQNCVKNSRGTEYPRGLPLYHCLLGEFLTARGRPGAALLHLVFCPDRVDLLHAALSASMDKVYPSERELVLLRTVLILLSLGQAEGARHLLSATGLLDVEYPHPCVQAAKLITEAVAAGDLAFFDEVRAKYHLVLRRDSSFEDYLSVCEGLLGREKAAPGGLAGLLSGLFSAAA